MEYNPVGKRIGKLGDRLYCKSLPLAIAVIDDFPATIDRCTHIYKYQTKAIKKSGGCYDDATNEATWPCEDMAAVAGVLDDNKKTGALLE